MNKTIKYILIAIIIIAFILVVYINKSRKGNPQGSGVSSGGLE